MLIFAYLSMLIDHIGVIFFPNEIIFRIIGRLALPIFAIRLTQGYKYTKNIYHYATRILILGIISQPIYYLTFGHESLFFPLNICFTLGFGLILIHFLEKIKEYNKILFYIVFLTIIFTSFHIPFEYGTYGILMILFVYYLKEKPIEFLGLFSLNTFIFASHYSQSIQYIPIFLFPFLLYFDEKKFLNIDMKVLGFKYAHYLFYPLHLLLLYIIKILYV